MVLQRLFRGCTSVNASGNTWGSFDGTSAGASRTVASVPAAYGFPWRMGAVPQALA